MKENWVFIATDRRFGERVFISTNYDEVYRITPQGTWVAKRDAEYLLSVRYPCLVCDGKRINVFMRVLPRDVDLAEKPDRLPRIKKREE